MGEWQQVDKGYLGLQEVFCDLCGQMIPRLAWREQVAGCLMLFCREQCARLMERYYLPRYGLPAKYRAGPPAS